MYDNLLDPSDDLYLNFNRIGADLQVDDKYFFFASEYGMGTDKVSNTLYGEPIGYQAILAVKTK